LGEWVDLRIEWTISFDWTRRHCIRIQPLRYLFLYNNRTTVFIFVPTLSRWLCIVAHVVHDRTAVKCTQISRPHQRTCSLIHAISAYSIDHRFLYQTVFLGQLSVVCRFLCYVVRSFKPYDCLTFIFDLTNGLFKIEIFKFQLLDLCTLLKYL